MVILSFMNVLIGILLIGLALWIASQAVGSIIESCKERKKIDFVFILFSMFIIGIALTLSNFQLGMAYDNLIERPKQEKAEKLEEEAKEREEEARREYIVENGQYKDEELDVVVVDKQTEIETSVGIRRNTYYTRYVIILEDASGYRYESNSRSLYYSVEIGDALIRKQTKVIDKNNGETLELHEPDYYRKES